MCTYILTAGYAAEPFDDRQVDRFLQQMEARVDQMRRAVDEKKVGSQVQSIVTTKTIPTLFVGSPLRACSCCVYLHLSILQVAVRSAPPPPPPPHCTRLPSYTLLTAFYTGHACAKSLISWWVNLH